MSAVDPPGMRALVTGCAGFIGSHLVEALLEDGVEVAGVDCFNDNYGRRQKLSNLDRAHQSALFDFVPVDLARGNLDDLVDEADVVYHLAAEPGVRASWGERFDSYLRNNVSATQRLLESMRRHPGKRFVYASSSSIYGEAEALPTPETATPRPVSPYGVTKLTAEQLCYAYHANLGIDSVSLRYFSVFGPRQRPDMAFTIFCRAALADEPLTVFGDGRQTRDFTFVGDIVSATRAAAAAPGVGGEAFNIGGGSQVSVDEAIELIEGFAGKPLEVRRQGRAVGDVRHTGADTSRARERLGFEARAEFPAALEEQFEWAVESFAARPAPS